MNRVYLYLKLLVILTGFFVSDVYSAPSNDIGSENIMGIPTNNIQIQDIELIPVSVDITPKSGPPGTVFTIRQLNNEVIFDQNWQIVFRYAASYNRFGEFIPTTPLSYSDREIKYRTPMRAVCGSHVVTSYERGGSRNQKITTPISFNITGPCVNAPEISSIDSVLEPGAIRITISGRNFLPSLRSHIKLLGPHPYKFTSFQPSNNTDSQIIMRLPLSDSAYPYCGNSSIAVKNSEGVTGSLIITHEIPCPNNVLSVLSWNIKLMPPRFFPNGVCYMYCSTLKRPGAVVNNNYGVVDNHDVIIFQEAFSGPQRREILDQLKLRYPEQTDVLASGGNLPINGGVVILSKWPIERKQQHIYRLPDGRLLCSGTDCGAKKGVWYVRINKHGSRYHLLGTHLNSGELSSEESSKNVRKIQLSQISSFIRELNIPNNEPIIIGGDFNVKIRTSEYDNMLNILDVTMPTLLRDNRFPPPPGNTTTTGNSYLDYVFYQKNYERPLKSTNQVLNVGGSSGSDHYPIVGRFIYPRPPSPQIIRLK